MSGDISSLLSRGGWKGRFYSPLARARHRYWRRRVARASIPFSSNVIVVVATRVRKSFSRCARAVPPFSFIDRGSTLGGCLHRVKTKRTGGRGRGIDRSSDRCVTTGARALVVERANENAVPLRCCRGSPRQCDVRLRCFSSDRDRHPRRWKGARHLLRVSTLCCLYACGTRVS